MEKFGVKVVKTNNDGQQVAETVVMSKPKIIKMLNEVVPIEDRWLWLRMERSDDGVLNTFEVRYYGNTTDDQRNAVRAVFEGNDEVLNVLTFMEQRKYGKKTSTVVTDVVPEVIEVVSGAVVLDEEVEDTSTETEEVVVVEFDDVEDVEVEE